MEDIIKNAAAVALSSVAKNLIEDVITRIVDEVGVESEDDLKLLKETDLVPLLKPIQARKLLAVLQKEETPEVNIQTSDSPPSVSIQNLPSSPSTTFQSSTLENTFPLINISWEKMPKKLMTALKKKRIPEASLRRQMIRIVAEDILESTSSPDRKLCREVAKNIATTYPDSFKDNVCGQILSNGFESLTSQLKYRCENEKRNVNKKYQEYQEKNTQSSDFVNIKSKKRIIDSYGCVNWSPEFPQDETTESLLKKKDFMKISDPSDYILLKKQIEETYCLQRYEINRGSGIKQLLKDWPNLFTEVGLKHHFQLLTAINVEEKLASSIDAKISDYWKFFRCQKKKEFVSKIMAIEAKKENPEFNEYIGLLQAMAAYFGEDISKFILTSEICDPHNLEHMDLIPEAPCLVAVGTDQLTADTFMLIIDKTVINSQLSRTGALTNFFAVFFIFNIRYPDELKLTLEFMQRCIFGINPHSGSKVQRKKGGKYMSTHPKLVAFSQRFQEILFFTDDRVS